MKRDLTSIVENSVMRQVTLRQSGTQPVGAPIYEDEEIEEVTVVILAATEEKVEDEKWRPLSWPIRELQLTRM